MSTRAKLRISTLNVGGVSSRKKQTQSEAIVGGKYRSSRCTGNETLCDKPIGKALEIFLSDYEVSVSHSLGFYGGWFLLQKKKNVPVK